MNDIKALIKLTFIGLAILMLTGCYGFQFQPHPLGIVGDAQGCPTDVEEREQNVCTAKTGEEGLCVTPGEWVKWSRAVSGGFRIDFEDESMPMGDDCALETSGESLKCQVASDATDGVYKYSVLVEDCADLDPRIIVRSK